MERRRPLFAATVRGPDFVTYLQLNFGPLSESMRSHPRDLRLLSLLLLPTLPSTLTALTIWLSYITPEMANIVEGRLRLFARENGNENR